MPISKRKTRKSRKPRKSRKSKQKRPGPPRQSLTWASPKMNMTELQDMAKNRDITWVGVSKTRLIDKLNEFY